MNFESVCEVSTRNILFKKKKILNFNLKSCSTKSFVYGTHNEFITISHEKKTVRESEYQCYPSQTYNISMFLSIMGETSKCNLGNKFWPI